MKLPSFLLLLAFTGLAILFAIRLPTVKNGSIPPVNTSPSGLLAKIQAEIVAPPPLTGSVSGTSGYLTTNGVLLATNQQRTAHQQKELSLNQTLSQAAQIKLQDMFAQQYFEHVSPTGIGPADIVQQVNYQFLRVGENLALGNYQDDAALVQAWMDSPGHRANILSPNFTEIGLAVGQGEFNGHRTWLAVQTFGLPASVCPQPDTALQSSFDQKKTNLAKLAANLTNQKEVLDNQAQSLTQRVNEITQTSNAGNDKIKQGNKLIKQGNDLAKQGQTDEVNSLYEQGQALQQTGQQLIEDARKQQDTLAKIQDDLSHRYDLYNQQVTTYNQQNKELKVLADQLNNQIKLYNSCVKQYQE